MTPKASDMNFSDNCMFIDAQDCVEDIMQVKQQVGQTRAIIIMQFI